MSFWNSNFKNHILEPLYFDQNRCEFRLPENAVWSADLTLANLGCIAAADNRQFPATSGFWELIKNIYLYSDNIELAHLRNVSKYMGFKNMIQSNDDEYSLHSVDVGNKYGFTIQHYDKRMALENATVYNNLKSASNNLEPKANLRLRDALPFLTYMRFLDGRKLNRLRVVIEWKAASDVVLVGGGNITSITRPNLVCNEVINEDLIKQLPDKFQVVYTNIDDESFNISAIAGNSERQSINQRLRAFNKKYLARILLINDISDQTNGIINYNTQMLGNHSMAFGGERINFRLNGRKLLADRGVDSPDCKLAMCTDTWGAYVLPPSSQTQLIGAPGNAIDDRYNREVYNGLDNNAYFQASYGGVEVNDNVQELELEYERVSNSAAYDPANGNPQPGALNIDRCAFQMRVYGECARMLDYSNGELMIKG